MQDVDLPGDIPRTEGVRAAFTGLNPVNPPSELGEPSNDVSVRVDDPHHRISVATEDDAALTEKQPGDDAAVAIRFNMKRPPA
ncbi:hypothetical protein OG819_55145 [Streptomyces sp. NBC_01549]|uniref:hypothetical protein n=1 Tax=Streptomyces sp. NBC_01549 TaxID=2975874 RepID=UPI002251A71C|nr:hypothetical protein [Streptomyces sp. NBC_01549]MCX4598295.1 hypothetical protein [Streptomyces sp. NBC_01549]